MSALTYLWPALPFDGKKAAEIKLVNYSVPKAKLKEETVALAKLLMEKDAHALRATKEPIRAVRYMSHDQALQYLASKIQALQAVNKGGSDKGIAHFIAQKSYRPRFARYH